MALSSSATYLRMTAAITCARPPTVWAQTSVKAWSSLSRVSVTHAGVQHLEPPLPSIKSPYCVALSLFTRAAAFQRAWALLKCAFGPRQVRPALKQAKTGPPTRSSLTGCFFTIDWCVPAAGQCTPECYVWGWQGEGSAELVMKTKPQEPLSINEQCLREAASKEIPTGGRTERKCRRGRAGEAWSVKWKWRTMCSNGDVYTSVTHPSRPIALPPCLVSLHHLTLLVTLMYLSAFPLSSCHDHQPPEHHHGEKRPDQRAELYSARRATHHHPLGEGGHRHWCREESPLLHHHKQEGGWSHLYP